MIDVSKCKFNSLNRCKSPINKHDIECDKVPIEKCYYKQLQQAKQGNARLLKVINDQPLKTVDIDSAFEVAKLRQKLEKIKERFKQIINDDVCISCNDFQTQNRCYQCDYEHHREEIYNNSSNYSLAKDILQIIEEE